MPDTNGAVTLGSAELSPEQEEALRQIAKDHPEDVSGPDQVVTAFAVVLTREGDVMVISYDNDDLLMDIKPTADLIYGMAATVQKDIASGDGARHTLELQMQQARAMSEQMQQAQIAAQLKQSGGLRG